MKFWGAAASDRPATASDRLKEKDLYGSNLGPPESEPGILTITLQLPTYNFSKDWFSTQILIKKAKQNLPQTGIEPGSLDQKHTSF